MFCFDMFMLWAFSALIATVLSDDTSPKALVIPASQHFEGNDGPWSTFDVRVGTPEQYARVLVSTASPETFVVVSEYGCSSAVFAAVPSNCAVSRGNLVNLNQSSSRHELGLFDINENGVGLGATYGYSQRSQFGLDHLGIGLTGPVLENQTVAGFATPEPFYLGVFGLNNQPLNFTVLGNFSAPSFLTTLKDQKKIPSLSWSYTAGAKYRLKQVYGQLIFSGYDTSRFEQNSVSFTMAEDITRDLVVALQSVSYSGSSSATLLSNPIDVFIDSTDPNLWLPAEACDAFEKAFGLTLDSKSGLYLVNDTHRNALLDSNAEVTFRLSDGKSGGDTVTIVLPFAAFDLTAGYPLVESSSHYFPLKRANSSDQYTLGRTFLQEAYLTADYERKTFNVSACAWNQGVQQNIVTITDPATGAGGATGGWSPSSGNSSSSNLSTGAIAGIAVACVVVGILVALAFAIVILRKRRKRISRAFAVSARPPEPDESILKGPVFGHASPSTPDRSMPYSAADVGSGVHLGRASTADYSRSGVDSPASGSVAVSGSGAGGSTVELDGRQIRPNTELDGREVQKNTMEPVAENPGVYELSATPGVTAGGSKRLGEPVSDREATSVTPPSDEERRGKTESQSPPSPMTSTMDTSWVRDEKGGAVSPTTPARYSHGARPF
ncbi:aspartic peptidase domain-containing protein [Podospora didyma]|uniref:Aspartic peptidase domain-containing protein n=1 Tax=Podospora didyma TaxID=330526 RepID=A0AAE0K8K2_9PEZI|nr:aspartic peptidase domain-containing protein [Podospora didyma]